MTNKIGIVAFAFGTPENIPSNICIARNTMEEAKKFDAPVYTQRDISIDIKEDGLDTTYTEETPNCPPPTLRIARGAMQWAKKRGINTIIVVAANPHLWRALRDTKRAVCEKNLRISVYPCRWRRSNSFWFCHESTQKRTRTWWNWWSREIIIKLMPFWLYKIIAR